jgi:PDZ domain-containing protein
MSAAEPVQDAVPPPPAGSLEEEPPRPSRPRRGWLFLLPIGVVAIVLVYVRIPYFVLSPGPAEDVLPLIHIRGHELFQPKGRLLLTSVFETATRVNLYEALEAWIDPARAVVPERDILAPGQSVQQSVRVALSEMDTSKIDAAVVALTKYAGYPRAHGQGALVEGVVDGTPAAGKLFAGDLVLTANGAQVPDAGALGEAIRRTGVGHPLALTVTAAGHTRTVRVVPVQPRGVDHPIIGVYSVDNFPFPLTISSGDIGGPSAGLMWTVGLIDLLTPGDLTHGHVIAGTGTIDPTGKVGPIGGIEQKVIAAERAGAVVFFAPAGEASDARSVAHRMMIVSVATYSDAVAWLQAHR